MVKQEPNEIRVFAPASVANVAGGYDVLSFTINAPVDEVVVRHSDKPDLRITKITSDDTKNSFQNFTQRSSLH